MEKIISNNPLPARTWFPVLSRAATAFCCTDAHGYNTAMRYRLCTLRERLGSRVAVPYLK